MDAACGGDDCDASNPDMNLGAAGVFNNRMDDDGHGLRDEDCGYSATTNARASRFDGDSLRICGLFSPLAFLLIPGGAVILLGYCAGGNEGYSDPLPMLTSRAISISGVAFFNGDE